jgi:hypothetical protein
MSTTRLAENRIDFSHDQFVECGRHKADWEVEGGIGDYRSWGGVDNVASRSTISQESR